MVGILLFKRCSKKDFKVKRTEGARSKMLTMMMVICEIERVGKPNCSFGKCYSKGIWAGFVTELKKKDSE